MLRLEILLMLSSLAVFAVVLMIITRRMKQRRASRFTNRPTQTPKELFDEIRPQTLSEDQVWRIVSLVGEETDVPADKLQLSDRFLHELLPEKGWEWDNGLWVISQIMSREFGGTLSDYDFDKCPTLRDLIRAVDANLTQRRIAGS